MRELGIFDMKALAVGLVRVVIILFVAAFLSACSGFNPFAPAKITEEEIIPAEELYESAIADLDRRFYRTSLSTFEKLERQHPYSEYSERSKLMTTFVYYQLTEYEEAVLAADRYLAIHPSSDEVDYVLFLKASSLFNQIKDITRDQQLARDTIDTSTLLVRNYPTSEYAPEAKEYLRLALDQVAGKEMSVGRHYLGNGQYTAAINRFRSVVEKHQTSTHIEEALFRLTEAYLKLGLVNEAQNAAAVLGLNYPSSSWYQDSFDLLGTHSLSPQQSDSSWLNGALDLNASA